VSTAAIIVTVRKLIVARGGIAGTAAEDLHLDI
jgi:hypothetical protein